MAKVWFFEFAISFDLFLITVSFSANLRVAHWPDQADRAGPKTRKEDKLMITLPKSGIHNTVINHGSKDDDHPKEGQFNNMILSPPKV